MAGQLDWTAAVEEAYATPLRLWFRDTWGNVLSVPWRAGKVPASKAQIVARFSRALAVHDNVGAYISSALQLLRSWLAHDSSFVSHQAGACRAWSSTGRHWPARAV